MMQKRSLLAMSVMILASTVMLHATEALAAKAVFTSTNAVDGNTVVMYKRSNNNGSLTLIGEFDTGGTGTGTGLSNQGAVVLTNNGKWLLVVNAGSDDVTVFSVDKTGSERLVVETVR